MTNLLPTPPLDILYLFRHSPHGDEEIRFSLRSVAAHLPFIRKVWIFGDKPAFLSADKSLIEHVPHAYIAPLLGCQLPVRSDMHLTLLASLLPELTTEFVRFSDDYIVLNPISREQLCQVRALEDLNAQPARGGTPWKQSLWHTFDLLKKYGYPGYNFDSHVPAPLNKRMVFEAFMAFRPFLSEERHAGLVAPTAIYNYAVKHFGLPFIWIKEEQSRAGFYGSAPTSQLIATACADKLFLNFDDAAFGPTLLEFLRQHFPTPCKFEHPFP